MSGSRKRRYSNRSRDSNKMKRIFWALPSFLPISSNNNVLEDEENRTYGYNTNTPCSVSDSDLFFSHIHESDSDSSNSASEPIRMIDLLSNSSWNKSVDTEKSDQPLITDPTPVALPTPHVQSSWRKTTAPVYSSWKVVATPSAPKCLPTISGISEENDTRPTICNTHEDVQYLFTLGSIHRNGVPRKHSDTLSNIHTDHAVPRQDLNQVYKKSTERFLKALSTMVPLYIFRPGGGVDEFKDAADYIVRKKLPVQEEMIRDLELSIRGREHMAQDFGDDDSGHKYFIDALVYCWTVLSPLVILGENKSNIL